MRAGGSDAETFARCVEVMFHCARTDPRSGECLGMRQITFMQDAIIVNLAATVMGDDPFLVIDVGAHDGWFIDRIMQAAPGCEVIAFEPLPCMQPELQKRRTRYPRLEVLQTAVGDTETTLPLRNYRGFPGLSSLLDFSDGYRYFDGHFDSTDYEVVEVPVLTLDGFLDSRPDLMARPNIALKIDVQGFEWPVLAGAAKLLESGKVRAILIELCLRTKYAGAMDFLELGNRLADMGFRLYDTNPFYREVAMQFQSRPVGRLTELDCLFVHERFLQSQAAPS